MDASIIVFFFLRIRRPPRSSLFPTTTLFRSRQVRSRHGHWCRRGNRRAHRLRLPRAARSEEHTSELQSRQYLVCRLLLEKKNNVHCVRGSYRWHYSLFSVEGGAQLDRLNMTL